MSKPNFYSHSTLSLAVSSWLITTPYSFSSCHSPILLQVPALQYWLSFHIPKSSSWGSAHIPVLSNYLRPLDSCSCFRSIHCTAQFLYTSVGHWTGRHKVLEMQKIYDLIATLLYQSKVYVSFTTMLFPFFTFSY